MARLGGMDPKEIRSLLQGKHHPDLVKCVAGISERQDHLFHLLGQLASAMDTLADSILAQAGALDTLKSAHDRAKAAKAMGVKVSSGAADEE